MVAAYLLGQNNLLHSIKNKWLKYYPIWSLSSSSTNSNHSSQQLNELANTKVWAKLFRQLVEWTINKTGYQEFHKLCGIKTMTNWPVCNWLRIYTILTNPDWDHPTMWCEHIHSMKSSPFNKDILITNHVIILLYCDLALWVENRHLLMYCAIISW